MAKTVGLVFPKKTKDFMCPECDKVCKSLAALDNHMKEKHDKPANPAE